jgi:eukaryotic-like serine/threonine-protein kinase
MPAAPRSLKEEFLAALAIAPAERAAWLEQACGQDAEMRQQVELMLAAADTPQSLLDRPAFVAVRSDAVTGACTGAEAERPDTVIGPYKLLQQIGEGGMGTVWMAEQTKPVERKVALKVIKPGMDSRQIIARFEAERQALAILDHVNIARVLDAGTTESGLPYFVMELVHGVPITKYCDDNHLTPRERLELFVPVCQAIQHAHQKGIIHRDIKPSNVMVTLYDGKPVPKVIDFGVAKATEQKLTERTLFTQYSTMVGTLEYMSPEQAGMSALGVDTRSDIYSLGVLLYELLTGNTPLTHKRMKEGAYAEIIRMIREEEPPRPSTRLSDSGEALASISAQRHMEPAKLTKLVKGELDWIVMKTLEKDRNRRYETAKDFSADVQRYLTDERVLACPPSAGYRLRKFTRRNKGPVVAASLVLASLVIGVVGMAWGVIRATHAEANAVREAGEKTVALGEKTVALGEKETALATARANELEAHKQEALANENAKTAKEQELLARRRQYASQINLAQQAWEIRHSTRVLELLEGQRPKFDQEDLRSFEWYYLWQQCHKHQRLSWRARRDDMFSVALSPDGTMVASASHDKDGTVKLWSTANGQQRLALRGHRTGVWCVAFSPDGKILASGSVDGTLKLWDPATGQELATIVCNQSQYGVRGVAFSPDGKTLATSNSDNNTVKLWDLTTKQQCGVLKGHTGETITVAFSPDGKMLATGSGSGDGSVKIWSWDGTTAQERVTIQPGSGSWGLPVRFSPDSKTLAIGANTVDLYDVTTGNKRASLPGYGGSIGSLAFSPDGKTLAAGRSDRTVRVWDLASGQERNQLPHLSPVNSVGFSSDGTLLVSGCDDGIVKLWELGSALQPDTLKHVGAVKSVAFSGDGQTLISGGDQPTKLWDVATGKEKGTLPGPIWSAPISQDGRTREASTVPGMWSGAISQDGSTLSAPSPDKTITVWDLRTGKAKARFQEEKAASGALSFDGATLVTFRPYSGRAVSTSASKSVELWNTATGQLRTTFRVQDLSVVSVAFSPDGKILATGGQICEISLWDAATGKQKLTFDQGESGFSAVLSLRFSPDGKTLATGSSHGTVRLRDVATGQLLASLKGHSQGVVCIAFSPDGKTVATACDGVNFWDSATGQERLTLKTGAVTCVAFAPDGKTLATASGDGTVNLWRAATDQAATALQNEVDPDDPESPVAVNALGDRLWKVGEPGETTNAYQKAQARAEKLATAFPDIAEYRLELAYSLFAGAVSVSTDRAPTPEQAHRRVREVYQTLPPDQQHTLALRYASLSEQLAAGPDSTLRDPRRAVEFAKEAVELCPNEASVWYTLGVARYRAGDWKGAALAMNKSLEVRNTGEFRTWFFLSMACWKLGSKDEARKWYTAALVWTEKRAPEHEELLRLRGEAAALLGLSEKAADLAPRALTDDLQLWTLTLDADAKAAWAYRARGQIQLSRRNFDKAILDFTKVIDLEPLDPKAWYDRGGAHYRAGDWKAAIKSLENSMRLLPDKQESSNTFFLAMAHWQLGEKDKARVWYDKAVGWMEKNQPKNEELRRFRAEASELFDLKEKK